MLMAILSILIGRFRINRILKKSLMNPADAVNKTETFEYRGKRYYTGKYVEYRATMLSSSSVKDLNDMIYRINNTRTKEEDLAFENAELKAIDAVIEAKSSRASR